MPTVSPREARAHPQVQPEHRQDDEADARELSGVVGTRVGLLLDIGDERHRQGVLPADCSRAIARSVSFQLEMTCRMKAVRIPPLARGSVMRISDCTGLAPSMAAASSTSSGMLRKNATSRNTVNGSDVPM